MPDLVSFQVIFHNCLMTGDTRLGRGTPKCCFCMLEVGRGRVGDEWLGRWGVTLQLSLRRVDNGVQRVSFEGIFRARAYRGMGVPHPLQNRPCCEGWFAASSVPGHLVSMFLDSLSCFFSGEGANGYDKEKREDSSYLLVLTGALAEILGGVSFHFPFRCKTLCM